MTDNAPNKGAAVRRLTARSLRYRSARSLSSAAERQRWMSQSMKTIYIISGISGSGKSTLVAPLKSKLGDCWDVWDIDPMVENMPDHGHPELPRLSAWNPGDGEADYNTCKNAVIADAASNAHRTILCGTLLPHEVGDAVK